MKTKTQILTSVHNHDRENQTPLYCPFTGKIIIQENPREGVEDFDLPKTILAIWRPEFLGWDEPDIVSDEFNFDLNKFCEIDNIEDCSKLIDELAGGEHYLLIDYSSYGSFPGIYSRCVYLFKIPNTYKYF